MRISQDLEFWGMLATKGAWGFIPRSFWIGDSRVVGAQSGWKKKYAKRRRLCPTVEQWQQRLVDQIPESSRAHFETVRARVAAGYMYSKIVGGDLDGARHIFENYGHQMKSSPVKTLVKTFSVAGSLGWHFSAAVLRLRERLK